MTRSAASLIARSPSSPAVNWREFRANAPQLAALGEERFERSGLVLLATLRKNGWPRISPVEFVITGGNLYLGMMWQSRKALDLLRDSRCSLHSTVSDRSGAEGEFKLYGRAVEIKDLAERRRYSEALYVKIGFKPEEPEYHLFSIDIESASFAAIENGEWRREIWRSQDEATG